MDAAASRSSSVDRSRPGARTLGCSMNTAAAARRRRPLKSRVLIGDAMLGTVRVGGRVPGVHVAIPPDIAAAAAARGEPVRITLAHRTGIRGGARHAGRPRARRHARSRGGKIATQATWVHVRPLHGPPDIDDRRERALVAVAERCGAGRAAPRLRRRAGGARDASSAPARADRRSADDAAGARGAPRAGARGGRSISSWAAGTRHRRGASRASIASRRWTPPGCRAAPAGRAAPLGLALQARTLATRRYDLAINFEPDIRTQSRARRGRRAANGRVRERRRRRAARRRAGLRPAAHTARTRAAGAARRIGRDARRAGDVDASRPGAATARRRALLAPLARRTTVGIHVSGGRAIKQWPETRFREVADGSSDERRAAIVAHRARPPIGADRGRPHGAAAGRVVDLSARGSADCRGGARTARSARHRRHRTDAPRARRRHADRRGVRPVRSARVTLRAASRHRRPHRPAVQPVQPHPPAARALPGHTPDCLAGIEVAQVLAAIDETLTNACDASSRRR